jgi:hypothetical protein
MRNCIPCLRDIDCPDGQRLTTECSSTSPGTCSSPQCGDHDVCTKNFYCENSQRCTDCRKCGSAGVKFDCSFDENTECNDDDEPVVERYTVGPPSAGLGGCVGVTSNEAIKEADEKKQNNIRVRGGSKETMGSLTSLLNQDRTANQIGMFRLSDPDVQSQIYDWVDSVKIDPSYVDFDPATSDQYQWSFEDLFTWAYEWISNDFLIETSRNEDKTLGKEYGVYAGLKYETGSELYYILQQARNNIRGFMETMINECGSPDNIEKDNPEPEKVKGLNVVPYYMGYKSDKGMKKYGEGLRTYDCNILDTAKMSTDASDSNASFFMDQKAYDCKFWDGGNGVNESGFGLGERSKCIARFAGTKGAGGNYAIDTSVYKTPQAWIDSKEVVNLYNLDESPATVTGAINLGPLTSDLKYIKKPVYTRWTQQTPASKDYCISAGEGTKGTTASLCNYRPGWVYDDCWNASAKPEKSTKGACGAEAVPFSPTALMNEGRVYDIDVLKNYIRYSNNLS